MTRILAIAACGFSLAACSTVPGWMQFGPSTGAPAATTIQFESEPAGAEARTSLGQTCRTPCSVAVAGDEFTVSFTLQGYEPQTVPVRAVTSNERVDYDAGQTGGPRLVPNPVFVELEPAAPPPPPTARRRTSPPPTARPTAQRPPTTQPQRTPTAQRTPAAPRAPSGMTPAPAPAPASPWPPPR
jgi:hypothetical protein